MSTLQRRRYNRIMTLKDSVGNWSFDHTQLKNQIYSYYNHLFQTTQSSSSNIHPTSNSNASLTVDDQQKLQAPLTIAEIRQALLSFRPFKAPGPDGLHLFFPSNIGQKWGTP